MRVFGRRCPFGRWCPCTPASPTANGCCTWRACWDRKETFFSTLPQPPQDQQGFNRGITQCLAFSVKHTSHTCKSCSLTCTAFPYSDGLSNDKLFKGKWNSKFKKEQLMEITWGETYGLDRVAGCVSEAGPERPWASQQRSLQPAAAPFFTLKHGQAITYSPDTQ